jgi:hypothetical protein
MNPRLDKNDIRPVGPSVIDPGGYDYPWTVARVQFLGKGRVRV